MHFNTACWMWQMPPRFSVVLLHHKSCLIPSCTMCLNRWIIKADVQEVTEHVDGITNLGLIFWFHNRPISTFLIITHLNPSPPSTRSSPDLLPSFSFSSCPSSRNSRRRARWCHKGGCPAPPTPPAARVTSRQPDDKTGSSGCKRSSPLSGKEGRRRRRLKKRWIEGINLKSLPPKRFKVQ